MLQQSDEVLGLALPAGRKGGYRPRLEKLLRKWERETNERLAELYDEEVDEVRRLVSALRGRPAGLGRRYTKAMG